MTCLEYLTIDAVDVALGEYAQHELSDGRQFDPEDAMTWLTKRADRYGVTLTDADTWDYDRWFTNWYFHTDLERAYYD